VLAPRYLMKFRRRFLPRNDIHSERVVGPNNTSIGVNCAIPKDSFVFEFTKKVGEVHVVVKIRRQLDGIIDPASRRPVHSLCKSKMKCVLAAL
jgi:hypothetical protein